MQEHLFVEAIVGRPRPGPDGSLLLSRQSLLGADVRERRVFDILRLRTGQPEPDVIVSLTEPTPLSESYFSLIGWDEYESAVIAIWNGPDRDVGDTEYRWYDLDGRLLRSLPVEEPDIEVFAGPGAVVWTSRPKLWAWTRGDEAARLLDDTYYATSHELALTEHGFLDVLASRVEVRRIDELGRIEEDYRAIHDDERVDAAFPLASAGSHVLMFELMDGGIERFRLRWLDADGRSIAIADLPGWNWNPYAVWGGEAYVVQVPMGRPGDERTYLGRLGCQH